MEVGLPDTVSREDMWRGLLAGVPIQGGPVDVTALSHATAGYSGAEVSCRIWHMHTRTYAYTHTCMHLHTYM